MKPIHENGSHHQLLGGPFDGRYVLAMEHKVHQGTHPHRHRDGCGHTAVHHDGHVDYLHDGHLHHPHEDHVDEHVIAVDAEHPDSHSDGAECDPGHTHGEDCGHEAVPHGDHVDYLVDGQLHHPHGDHCDDHGPLATA